MTDPVSQTTDLDRRLLLAIAEAVRFLEFDGTVPPDVMRRLADAEAAIRAQQSYQNQG